MRSVGSFFFREDPHGLSVLNTGIPAYSARIGVEQLRHRPTSVPRHTRLAPRPLEISWFGPRPANEPELIDELWVAVDEFCGRKAGTPHDRVESPDVYNRSVTVPTVLSEEPSRLSTWHS